MIQNISVDLGKYEFISEKDNYRIYIFRHGRQWVTIDEGCNAVLNLMHTTLDLQEQVQKLQEQIALMASSRPRH